MSGDLAAITAFIEARAGEDKSVAEGLMFACRMPDRKPDFFGCGGPAAEAFWERFTARRMLDEAEATRKLVAEITAIPHLYVDGDTWWSCSQALAEDWPGRSQEPGSGCSDDTRAGKSCDCGRDARVMRLLGGVVGRWSGHPDYGKGWTP